MAKQTNGEFPAALSVDDVPSTTVCPTGTVTPVVKTEAGVWPFAGAALRESATVR